MFLRERCTHTCYLQLKPNSQDWCAWPIFGASGYFPCHRISKRIQLFVTGAVPQIVGKCDTCQRNG